MRKLKYIAPILIAIVGFGLQQAKADTSTSYTLGIGNPGINGYSSPYGTLNVTLNTAGTAATFTFTAATGTGPSGPVQYLFGDGGSIGLNVNGNFSWDGTFTGVNQPQFNAQFPSFTQSSGNEDGFGSFNFSLDNFDGYQYAFQSLTFTLTGSWADVNSVLIGNNLGFFAAGHIFVTTDNYQTNTGVTGYAANGTVPDGGTTVMLLGAALGALGMARRFLRS